MEFNYGGRSRKSGVYKITNKINGKMYIGSCKEFKRRSKQHLYSLEKNKHRNSHLQASFNKHGSGAFLFEVIEIILGDKLARTTREEELLQEQIAQDNWNNCYNFCKRPVQRERRIWSSTPKETREKLSRASKGRKHSAETIEKIRQGNLGKFVSASTKEKMSIAHKGQSVSEQTKEKLRAHAKRQWTEKSIEDRKALAAAASKANSGKKHTQETRRRMSEAQKGNKHRQKPFTLVSPSGKKVSGINIKQFAIDNNLNPTCLSKVVAGKRKSHKHWTKG